MYFSVANKFLSYFTMATLFFEPWQIYFSIAGQIYFWIMANFTQKRKSKTQHVMVKLLWYTWCFTKICGTFYSLEHCNFFACGYTYLVNKTYSFVFFPCDLLHGKISLPCVTNFTCVHHCILCFLLLISCHFFSCV